MKETYRSPGITHTTAELYFKLSFNRSHFPHASSRVFNLLVIPKVITQPPATRKATLFTDLPLYFKLCLPGLLLHIPEKSGILQM